MSVIVITILEVIAMEGFGMRVENPETNILLIAGLVGMIGLFMAVVMNAFSN